MFNDWSMGTRQASLGNPKNSSVNYNQTYIAWVMDNSDAQRMGRLRVYIPDFGGDPADENNWVIVAYCSPFAGATNPWPSENILNNDSDSMKRRKNGNQQDQQTHEATQQSYGFWAIPPDINNEVLVGFASGDPNKGYFIGCFYQRNMNNMVPGIPSSRSHQGTGIENVDPPTSEYNRLVTGFDGVDQNNVVRPEFKPLNDGLIQQGLISDTLRGTSTSSARREAPSEVLGILTPKGSQFVMDDLEGNELIRLRTKSGAQILISETAGHVYMVCKSGDAWLELNDEGHCDIYAAKSVSVHSEININLMAKLNVNIEALGDINMKAGGSIQMDAGKNIDSTAGAAIRSKATTVNSMKAGNDIRLTAGGKIDLRAGGDVNVESNR